MAPLLPFAKYQALGNDFVVVDARDRPRLVNDADLAIRVLDRHRGVGGDDLILVTESSVAQLGMRIRTPSGGWLSMCGNGIRCLGRYARDAGLWTGRQLTVETDAGVRELTWHGGPEELIGVDLLQPDLRAASIPTTLAAPAEHVIDRPLDLRQSRPSLTADGGHHASIEAHDEAHDAGHDLEAFRVLRVTCVSVGNPHAVFFVDDLTAVPMQLLGPAIERHPAFPEGVNVHAAQVLAPDRARILTWERGAGLTLA